MAYETYGALDGAKSNAILIELHAFSGDAHAAGVDRAARNARMVG